MALLLSLNTLPDLKPLTCSFFKHLPENTCHCKSFFRPFGRLFVITCQVYNQLLSSSRTQKPPCEASLSEKMWWPSLSLDGMSELTFHKHQEQTQMSNDTDQPPWTSTSRGCAWRLSFWEADVSLSPLLQESWIKSSTLLTVLSQFFLDATEEPSAHTRKVHFLLYLNMKSQKLRVERPEWLTPKVLWAPD